MDLQVDVQLYVAMEHKLGLNVMIYIGINSSNVCRQLESFPQLGFEISFL